MKTNLSVGVIGGGIGGLTAALALRAAGIDAQVFEQAATLGDAGAGIVISPNAARVLHSLGLADDLRQASVAPLAWHQRRWDDGTTLLKTPLAEAVEPQFGFPPFTVHRADLIAALAARLPQSSLHLNHRLTQIYYGIDGVETEFANGRRVKVDVLVGADGIHSVVRDKIFGVQKPRFTGCVAYRGIIPAERVAHLDLEMTAQVWMGPGRHFVHYFVRNKELVSFTAVVEQDTGTSETWTDQCERSELLDAFEGWHPQVRDLLAAVDRPYRWALYDRPTMKQWSSGRATLLGDACHPMPPFMAQSPVQAIEDGSILALCLAGTHRNGVCKALKRYESLRLGRTAEVQGLADNHKLRFHLPDGPGQKTRDAEMATAATDWPLRAVSWIYGYDATTLAPQPVHLASAHR